MEVMKKLILVFVFLLGIAGNSIAQCEDKLDAATKLFNIQKYDKAAKLYKQIINECGANYSGAQKKYNECMSKMDEVGEAAAFQACMSSNSIGACREYLSHYPNGTHAPQVRNKLNRMNEEWAKLSAEQKEKRLFDQCNTITACNHYLEIYYPNGKYVTQVLQKREELEMLAYQDSIFRVNAEKTGYMKNIRVLFQNAEDVYGEHVTEGPTSVFYASDLKFLSPLLYYDGMLKDETQVAMLYTRLFDPNGNLMQADNSPYAFTNYTGIYVYVGDNHTTQLSGFGSYRPGMFAAGTYIYEIWYGYSILYSTSFTVVDKTTSMSSYSWSNLLNKCFEEVTLTSDTDAYKGCLSASRKSKMGACRWNWGSYYFGDWSAGLMHGIGIYVASDYDSVSYCPGCKYYVGEWKEGIKSGEGSCYDASGRLVYYGNFEDDAPTDTYPMTGYNDYRFVCFGLDDGTYYFGEVQNDVPEGKGVQISNNGDLWYGDWSGGKKNGMGIALPYRGDAVLERWNKGMKK